MNVGMLMSGKVAHVAPEASIGAAAELMARHRIRRLPVVDERGRLTGILSATDLYRAFPRDVNPFSVRAGDAPQSSTRVSQVMSTRLLTTSPDTPIETAAQILREHKIGALPVLHEGRLVGMVTESDIFRAFVEMFASTERGARITCTAQKGEDLFQLIATLAREHGVRVLSLFSTLEDGEPLCVFRIAGQGSGAFVDALWRSGHPVQNVLHF